MAAGFRLERSKQDALRQFLLEHLAAPVAQAASLRHLAVDGALSAGAANQALMDLLDRAGPYGPGHPEPRFVFPAHRLRRVRLMKELHVRCTLHGQDGARLEACAFRVPRRRSARCCCKERDSRFTSRVICAAPVGRAGKASS